MVIKNRKIALRARKQGGMFRVMAATTTKELEQKEGELLDYHCWCEHTNLKTIFFTSKANILPAIKEQQDSTNCACQTCMKGKITRTVIQKRSKIGTHMLGELIHTDLCGSMQRRSIKGNTYMVTYLDDKIGKIHLEFLSKKLQQFKEFKAYHVAFERQWGIKVKCFRTDGGG